MIPHRSRDRGSVSSPSLAFSMGWEGRELVAACSIAMCSPKYRAMSWLMPLPLRPTTSRRAESDGLEERVKP